MSSSSQQPSTTRAVLFMVALLVVACLGIQWGIAYITTSTEPSLAVGSSARLSNTSLDTIPVAIDEATLDALTEARVANDRIGFSQIFNSPQVFHVSNDTKVNILDLEFGKTQVRIEDGPAMGRTGWVVHEWVSPVP